MATVWRYTAEFQEIAFNTKCLSTLHYQTDVAIAGSEPSPQTVLDQLDQHYSSTGTNLSKWLSVAHNNTKLVRTSVYEELAASDTSPPSGAERVVTLSGTMGAIAIDSAPVPVCAYISLRTDKLGRSYRGGVHMPPLGIVGSLDSAGYLQTDAAAYLAYTAFAAVIEDALEDVFGGAGTGDLNPVIYSRTRRNRGLSPYTTKIKSTRVNRDLRWLRRRMTSP